MHVIRYMSGIKSEDFQVDKDSGLVRFPWKTEQVIFCLQV